MSWLRRSVGLAMALASAGCSMILPFDDYSEGSPQKKTPPCAFEFDAETRFPTSGYTQDVAIADFDDDGHLDLVVSVLDADATGPELLRGDGHGHFESWYQYSKFTLISRSVAAADFNGDKRQDIAISFQSVDSSTPSGSFDVDLGDGLATLSEKESIFTVPQAGDIAVGDFNGDGRIDAATIATQTENKIADEKLYVFLGHPAGGLDSPIVYDQNQLLENTLNAVTAADLNGDGRTDLAVSHWGSSSVSALLGAADGTFFVHGPFPTGSIPRGMALADFTHDGLVDIAVVSNGDNTVNILAGLGDGQFGAEKPYQMVQGPYYAVAADFDADGNVDVVAGAQDRFALRLGSELGELGDPKVFPIDGEALQMATADLNRDGLVDLAAANPFRESISVFLGRCAQ